MTISFALFCIIAGIGAANADSHSVNTTQCNACLEDDFGLCVNNTGIQNCTTPATDSCFSAAGRYKFTNGSTVVLAGVSRGCIACPSVTEGCKAFKVFFDIIDAWSLLDCNMVCCRGDLCNNQTISLKPSATTPTGGATPEEPTTEGNSSHYSPTTEGNSSHYSPTNAVLAIATIIGIFFF